MFVFWYQEEEYRLFLSEYDLLTGNEAGENEYFEEEKGEQMDFRIVDYRLFLEKKSGNLLTQEAVNYSGGVLIVKGILEPYEEYEDIFSYETVLELIFKDGCLITTVDHSKAGLRIRKNLEKGLRSLSKAKDRHCIRAFMKKTLICDYRQSRLAYSKRKLRRNIKLFMAGKGKVLKRKK